MKKEKTLLILIFVCVAFISKLGYPVSLQVPGKIDAQIEEHMKSVEKLKKRINELRKALDKLKADVRSVNKKKNIKQVRTVSRIASVRPPDSRLRTLQIKVQQIQELAALQIVERETDCTKYLDAILNQMSVLEACVEALKDLEEFMPERPNPENYPNEGGTLTEGGRAQYERDLANYENDLNSFYNQAQIVQNQIKDAENEIKNLEKKFEQCIKNKPLNPEEIKEYEKKFDKVKIYRR